MTLSAIPAPQGDLVEQLQVMAQERFGAGADRFAEFFRCLFETAPPADLVAERPESLAAAAASLLRFARTRSFSSPKLRLLQPTLEEDGYQCRDTVIEVVNDDMIFLVDSLWGALARMDIGVRLLLHPIVRSARDQAGQLLSLSALSSAAPSSRNGQTLAESIMHIRVAPLPKRRFAEVEAELRSVLSDVRASLDDFRPMREHCRDRAVALRNHVPAHGTAAAEAAQFLEWLCNQNFNYLGYSYCRLETAPVSSAPLGLSELHRPPPTAPGVRFDRDRGLGLLRDPNRSMFDLFEPPRKRELLRVLKANRISPVHRPVHLDTVIVSDFDESGQITGAHMFVGLFTSRAYRAAASEIPLVCGKIERALERSGFSPSSHNGRRLRFILESYPRDELLQISDADLWHIAVGILHLQYRPRVALFARRDPFGRFVSCLVYLPRDRMETALRQKLGELLAQAFEGSITAYYPQISDEPLARLHYIVKTPGVTRRAVDFAALERRLEQAARTWRERLALALPAELGEARAPQLVARYGEAFPARYQSDFHEMAAVDDIEHLEATLDTGKASMHLYQRPEEPAHELHVKLYSAGGFIELGRVMPTLENLGARVIAEVPYEVELAVGNSAWIHDFHIAPRQGEPLDLDKLRAPFIEAFLRVWDHLDDDDGFNQLVLRAQMPSRAVAVLRAYGHYLRQIRAPFSLGYMQQTLARNARLSRLLVELFEARFSPDLKANEPAGAGRSASLHAKILAQLEQVQSLDEDRILRQFCDVILATTRTNYYQGEPREGDEPGSERPSHLALKIDSRRVPNVPRPAPFREIFVSGPRTAGVHLRFGEVARGGLRWSDRLEDFRTEVLGLVKAQQVKNAVIVPVGSKGGFVVKQPPAAQAGRDALREEAVACYQIFVRSLLELTDNRLTRSAGAAEAGGEPELTDDITPPPRTVRHDAPDPYLVVAADKGTATFSDIANAISEERGFWLGDAFASGGSAGYDHKVMGITARGAWESVKRHFRELGKNIQEQPFTCAGVGDMSGDVFGNGMLLSRQTKLVAAFDHRHIFLDPSPDPERSYAERQRLFALPRSSWEDYDSALLSEGGGVYTRTLKSIPLSPPVQAMLDTRAEALSPTELISAIVSAPVELLFFGGIGTYVKATAESHADAGDRSNDVLRVDAKRLRARVVGEGANLGLTQRARVEYGLSGGRCNSDFIDNSAGVDCSDHEVNIKILLGEIERQGRLTRAERNELLATMTDELGELVLRNNYEQTQSLSITMQLGTHLTDRLARTLRHLERSGQLDRALEFLPDDETLAERQRLGGGFARAELCVLMAYAKNSLAKSLLEEGPPPSELLDRDLIDYFPSAVRQYRAEILRHRLRRQLTVTLITNDMVNRAGISFAHEVGETTGASPPQVALAYAAAREILSLRDLWSAIEGLDNQVESSVQGEMLVACARLLERVTIWLLREHPTAEIESHVESYRQGIIQLAEVLPALLHDDQRKLLDQRARYHRERGVPAELADRLSRLRLLLPAADIVRIAQLCELPLPEVGSCYFRVGTRFGLEWLRTAARELPTERSWDRQAVTGLVNDLFVTQRRFTMALLHPPPDDERSETPRGRPSAPPTPRSVSEGAVEAWVARHGSAIRRYETLLGELRTSSAIDLGMLTVAHRQLAGLLG